MLGRRAKGFKWKPNKSKTIHGAPADTLHIGLSGSNVSTGELRPVRGVISFVYALNT